MRGGGCRPERQTGQSPRTVGASRPGAGQRLRTPRLGDPRHGRQRAALVSPGGRGEGALPGPAALTSAAAPPASGLRRVTRPHADSAFTSSARCNVSEHDVKSNV